MAEKSGSFPRQAYAARMNRAIDYIDGHLGESLCLDVLAGVAAFSKFHFHRIFNTYTGETLADYIARQRLEKAAHRLLAIPDESVTDIALECGFSNSAVFAKNFKARFGMTASAWRKEKPGYAPREPFSFTERGGNADSAGDEGNPDPEVRVEYRADGQRWIIGADGAARTVRVTAVPEMTLAYVRYVGPYTGDAALFEELFRKLFAWLGPRNLVSPASSKALVIYHEYLDITPDERLRLSACCTVPADTEGGGDIGILRFAPGTCAVAAFRCAAAEYRAAWNWMYRTWLPRSGFAPADEAAFELYALDAHDQATGKTAVDICLPVTPL
jgi:AraC family transcriptional regulator